MSLRQNLATNLRRIRAEREMSQEDFAEVLEIDRTYLSDIERSKRALSIDIIEQMAERLELTFVDLLRDPHQGS